MQIMKSKATEGYTLRRVYFLIIANVETFFNKGKYNFVKQFSVETCIIQDN